MRWRTFERLAAEHDEFVRPSLQAAALKFELFVSDVRDRGRPPNVTLLFGIKLGTPRKRGGNFGGIIKTVLENGSLKSMG